MTAAPNSPLVEKVAEALHHAAQQDGARPCLWENLDKHNRGSYLDKAQAALVACEAEAMLGALRLLVAAEDEKERFGRTAHYESLKAEGWKAARALLARLERRSSSPPGLGYCPICGAPGRSREKRPDGNDLCESGHTYPSRNALLARQEAKP